MHTARGFFENTEATMQLKAASEMSMDELRAEVAKYEAQRAKRRAYNRAHRKAMTPELKAKLTAYNKQRREHQRAVLVRAAEVGLTGVAAEAGVRAAETHAPAKPQTQASTAKPTARPSKARRTA